jgi:hypothetical protein
MIDKPGEVAEWSNALDLKSSDSKESVGSNPTLSVSSGEDKMGEMGKLGERYFTPVKFLDN